MCSEEGRVAALHATTKSMRIWLGVNNTDPVLADCLVQYARGRGVTSMSEIYRGHLDRYHALGISHDKIGWRQFMDGMISVECVNLQQDHI